MKRVIAALLLPLAGASAQESGKLIPPIVVSLSSSEIAGFDTYPPAVQKLIESSLALTRKNLGYQYGSSDPTAKGMDCSGTIFYLLRAAGSKDVPRSSDEQYKWTLQAGTFHAVKNARLGSADFASLQPGDLLFWGGTYQKVGAISTHTMIYLGKAKSDGLPLMVGSSDGRTYRGKKCFGVSVFEFRMPALGSKARFLGYAAIPGQ